MSLPALTPLLVLLVQATPVPTDETPEATLKGLREVYAQSCGQTGIIYHAYDDLCDGLRKQIHAYEVQIDHDATAKAKSAPPPERSAPAKPQL